MYLWVQTLKCKLLLYSSKPSIIAMNFVPAVTNEPYKLQRFCFHSNSAYMVRLSFTKSWKNCTSCSEGIFVKASIFKSHLFLNVQYNTQSACNTVETVSDCNNDITSIGWLYTFVMKEHWSQTLCTQSRSAPLRILMSSCTTVNMHSIHNEIEALNHLE